MNQQTKQPKATNNFEFLFNQMEDLKITHSNLFVANSLNENVSSQSVEEIKRIVEACNNQETFATFTRV